VTQLAALNCIDDPTQLPIGATIWIPGEAMTGAQSGTPQPTANVESTEAATPEASASAPRVLTLTTSEATVENQAGFTVSWQAEGRDAYFYRCPVDPEAACRRPLSAAPLPLVNMLTISNFQYAGPVRYRLEIQGNGDPVTSDVAVTVVCSHDWL